MILVKMTLLWNEKKDWEGKKKKRRRRRGFGYFDSKNRWMLDGLVPLMGSSLCDGT